jgi:hypothetical protein
MFSADIRNILKFKMSGKCVQREAELFHVDKHEAANSHFSYFCECAYKAQDRQRTYNVTWRPNHFFAVEKQKILHIFERVSVFLS